MITEITTIKGLGRFKDQDDPVALGATTLVFGHNSRGKSTIASIISSYRDGAIARIKSRARADANALVKLHSDPGGNAVMNGEFWTATSPNILVFDDDFVESNVSSGYGVSFEHQTNLNSLILGETGKVLSKNFEDLGSLSKDLQGRLQDLENQIDSMATTIGFTGDQLLAAKNIDYDADEHNRVKRTLQLVASKQQILSRPALSEMQSFPKDLDDWSQVLRKSLGSIGSKDIVDIHAHVGRLGSRAEEWIESGQGFLNSSDTCPFCGQLLSNSSLISSYQSYYNQEVRQLVKTVTKEISEIKSVYDANLQTLTKTGQTNAIGWEFWRSRLELDSALPDCQELETLGDDARRLSSDLVRQKTSAAGAIENLSSVAEFRGFSAVVGDINSFIEQYNECVRHFNRLIAQQKESLVDSDSSELKKIDGEHKLAMLAVQHETQERISAFESLQCEKNDCEAKRKAAKRSLAEYQKTRYPEFQRSINDQLTRMGVEWTLGDFAPKNAARRTGAAYAISLGLDSNLITVGANAGDQGLGSVLSRGDRWTLAFAFFLGSIESMDLSSHVIVIDDPVTSLDDNRVRYTIELLQKLSTRCRQLIVLSHDPRFLAKLADRLGLSSVTGLEVAKVGHGNSCIRSWDIGEFESLEYAAQSKIVAEAIATGVCKSKQEVGNAIRNVLEHYLRLAYYETFRLDPMIGTFIRRVKSSTNNGVPMMSADRIDLLTSLNNFSRELQHSEFSGANEEEIVAYARRTADFIKGGVVN